MPIKIKNKLLIRRGMTLVELLVVMSIMVTFAAMTAAFYPSISSDNQISQTSNKIQNLLVGARQKARRDSNVTGVRFFPDTNNPSSATQMMLVQKPVDLTGSSLGAKIAFSSPNIVSFFLPDNSPNPVWGFTTGEDLIMANDILVDPLTNNSTNIIGRRYIQPTNTPDNKSMLINNGFYTPDFSNAPLNYKIIRQARIVPGEEAIPMPEGYEILLSPNGINCFFGPKVNPSDSSIDVCFEKTGAVYQIDFASNVYIWVHKTGSTKYSEDDAIIGIQRNNGKVAVFPVGLVDFNNATNSNLHDPFKFARDPANEGL
jgi:prepilin-type N-terminal cleavage/methylation domain-containing protein